MTKGLNSRYSPRLRSKSCIVSRGGDIRSSCVVGRWIDTIASRGGDVRSSCVVGHWRSMGNWRQVSSSRCQADSASADFASGLYSKMISRLAAEAYQ